MPKGSKKKLKKKKIEIEDEDEEDLEDQLEEEEESKEIKKKKKKHHHPSKKSEIMKKREEEEDGDIIDVEDYIDIDEEASEDEKEENEEEEDYAEIVEVEGELIEVTSSGLVERRGELEEVKEEKVRKGPPIRGMKFDMKEEKALAMAKKAIKKTLIGKKTKETIEGIDPVYWPMLWCRLVKAKRFLFLLRSKDVYTVFDPFLVRFMRFKEDADLKEVFKLDDRLIDLGKSGEYWREVRVLTSLQKEDMTINDLIPATGLPRADLDEAVKNLKIDQLVKTSEEAGDTPIYMPTIKMKVPSINDLKTKLPAMPTFRPKLDIIILEPKVGADLARSLVKGFFKDTALIDTKLFFMPFYRVKIMHRKKRTRRLMLVNARTGKVLSLKGKEAEIFL
jgi:hypothetical protein